MRLLPPSVAALGLLLLLAPQAPAQWTSSGLSVDRAAVASAALGDLIFFGGGLLDWSGGGHIVGSDVVDIYDAATGAWSVAQLSSARGEVAATTVGQLVFFAGGGNVVLSSDVVDIYDASVGPPSSPAAWSTVQLSKARSGISAVTVGDRALFAGGRAEDGVTTLVDVYDSSVGPPSDAAAWSTTDLSSARQGIAAVSVDGVALFAGGRVPGVGFSATVDIYDGATGTWSTQSLSQARSLGLHAAARVGHRAYFAGGVVSAFMPAIMSSVVDVYDAQSDSWSTLTLVLPRDSISVAGVGGRVLFAGGLPANAGGTDLVEIYDVGSESWLWPAQLSERRHEAARGVAHGRAVFAGGSPGPQVPATASDAVDIYTPCTPVGALETVRLGTPPNPAALLPGTTSAPVVAETWDPVIDHSSFLPGAVLDFVAIGLTPSDVPSPLGTLLCGAAPISIVTGAPGEPFGFEIPADCGLAGTVLCTQGGSIDAALVVGLTNALDITIGTF
ncbi:Kelch repeat-containing protein [Engelhardtia mirabilis]|uniref:Kelch motif protein n=1 Tax=Engelhardtia mirabilis TaxID=2528011 RepID=A0A518BGX7_9BACT|nr:Kelch motif protein [Planctomycetes bacterium Pla133]QDV00500.1 Kelch motif protein [Planctomycetes bacterium Pla86]